MSLLLDSYRRNAAAARLEGEQATLANVRERAVKAAERWSELAEKLQWGRSKAERR